LDFFDCETSSSVHRPGNGSTDGGHVQSAGWRECNIATKPPALQRQGETALCYV